MRPASNHFRICGSVCIIVAVLGLPGSVVPLFGALPPESLRIRSVEGGPRLELPREPVAPVAGSRYRLRLEASTDLHAWQPAGELETDATGRPASAIDAREGFRFFRLAPEIESGSAEVDGADIYGFNRVFQEEWIRAGYLTPAEFAARHQPGAEYLEQIGFDPRTAAHADGFPRNAAEEALFLRNGFVVSERLGRGSSPPGNGTFAEVFYRVFSSDRPVFISADAAVHAWHFSYAHMLAEIEETHLVQVLGRMLGSMAGQLRTVPLSVRSGPLQNSLADADYFLAVGLSLFYGSPIATVLGEDPNVAQTLRAITNYEQYVTPPGFPMFGGSRLMDFSQFKVRGHYDRSPALGRYFQTYLWTSRADLRVLDPEQPEQSRRELGTAIVLALLLRDSAAIDWRTLDDVVRLFVGRTDAMNYAQLYPLLAAARITSLASITNAHQLSDLQHALLAGDLGLQLIPGEAHVTPLGPEQAQLPRAFVFTGQRFVPDGWALAEVTFDRVKWFEDIPGATVDGKVLRRVPDGLDVAYGVLGNRQAGWEIGRRMVAPRVRGNFRDGYPYAHNLTALAATFDRLAPEAWTDTLYARWLWALRALSAPTTGPEFPQAMRTSAWAHRTLGVQLASYAELKHDTLLYAKQPYASTFLCEYPAGFVEPVPEFWRRMKELALAAATGLAAAPAPSGILVPPGSTPPRRVDRAERHQARIDFCNYFAAQMERLRRLAEKELRQEPFTTEETDFIRGLMNDRTVDLYAGATYDGWYPHLFYEDFALLGGTADENGSNQRDALVADVFTAPPDLIDPTGGVLHVGTGWADMLLIAVDNGPDRMVYAGPVLSFYEFLEPGPNLQRLSDDDWKNRLSNKPPARPTWTLNYLVPQ